jgi:hypothetical protein
MARASKIVGTKEEGFVPAVPRNVKLGPFRMVDVGTSLASSAKNRNLAERVAPQNEAPGPDSP